MNWQLYGGLYIINEMLFGQSRKQIDVMQRDMGLKLNVDEKNCFILLTGVKKQEYNQRLNIDRSHFVQLVFAHLRDFLNQLAQEERFDYELGVLNYDYSKRIIVIISPHRTRFDPIPCARRISGMIDKQYRKVGVSNPYFTNIMAVSEQIHCFEQIHTEFKKLMHLHDLAFFHRTSRPLTQGIMQERRIPYSMVEAERMIEDFSNAVYQQDTERSEELLRELVLGHLKACQDLSFCAEVYFLLRQRVRSMGLVLGVPIHRVDNFPHMGNFVSIEEQYEAMRLFLLECFFPQKRKPGCPGKISILAVTYINQNYYNPSLGLSDIAKYIHTNTAYLSRVFKTVELESVKLGKCRCRHRARCSHLSLTAAFRSAQRSISFDHVSNHSRRRERPTYFLVAISPLILHIFHHSRKHSARSAGRSGSYRSIIGVLLANSKGVRRYKRVIGQLSRAVNFFCLTLDPESSRQDPLSCNAFIYRRFHHRPDV